MNTKANNENGLSVKIVELLWSNARLADRFVEQDKGWDTALSEALSVSKADIQTAVEKIGLVALRKQVKDNPAGKFVSSVGVENPTLHADSIGCPGDTAHYCPTGSAGGCCPPSTYVMCRSLKKAPLQYKL